MHDTSVAPEAATALVEQAKAGGNPIQAFSCDAAHAFVSDTRPQVYNEHAATLAI